MVLFMGKGLMGQYFSASPQLPSLSTVGTLRTCHDPGGECDVTHHSHSKVGALRTCHDPGDYSAT